MYTTLIDRRNLSAAQSPSLSLSLSNGNGNGKPAECRSATATCTSTMYYVLYLYVLLLVSLLQNSPLRFVCCCFIKCIVIVHERPHKSYSFVFVFVSVNFAQYSLYVYVYYCTIVLLKLRPKPNRQWQFMCLDLFIVSPAKRLISISAWSWLSHFDLCINRRKFRRRSWRDELGRFWLVNVVESKDCVASVCCLIYLKRPHFQSVFISAYFAVLRATSANENYRLLNTALLLVYTCTEVRFGSIRFCSVLFYRHAQSSWELQWNCAQSFGIRLCVCARCTFFNYYVSQLLFFASCLNSCTVTFELDAHWTLPTYHHHPIKSLRLSST